MKKLKKPKIFFKPIEGSAPLSISFSDLPKGDATESNEGNGVGFFDDNSNLVSALFDDVLAKKDHQKMSFKNGVQIEIETASGVVKFKKTDLSTKAA